MGTLPSLGATLTLPHPCPSSSPLSIGRDGCFRLQTVSHRGKPPPRCPSATSDAAQSSAESAHAYASAFTDLHIAAIARWTDCRRRLQPQQYAVSKPISIAYARTCDAFLMSRLVWPAGICVACSICAAISQHTHPSVCRTTPHDLCIAHRQTRS